MNLLRNNIAVVELTWYIYILTARSEDNAFWLLEEKKKTIIVDLKIS